MSSRYASEGREIGTPQVTRSCGVDKQKLSISASETYSKQFKHCMIPVHRYRALVCITIEQSVFCAHSGNEIPGGSRRKGNEATNSDSRCTRWQAWRARGGVPWSAVPCARRILRVEFPLGRSRSIITGITRIMSIYPI